MILNLEPEAVKSVPVQSVTRGVPKANLPDSSDQRGERDNSKVSMWHLDILVLTLTPRMTYVGDSSVQYISGT